MKELRPLISGGIIRDGINPYLRAGDHALDYVSLDIIKLPPKTGLPGRSERDEALIVVLEGVVTVTAGPAMKGRSKTGTTSSGQYVWDSIGRRLKPSDGPPYAFYVPPGSLFHMWGETDALLAVVSSKSSAGGAVQLVTPEKTSAPIHDEWSWIIGPDAPAEKLLVAERLLEPGGTVNVPKTDEALEMAVFLKLHGDGGPSTARLTAIDSDDGVPLPDGAVVGLRGGGFMLGLPEGVSGYVLLGIVAADKAVAAGGLGG